MAKGEATLLLKIKSLGEDVLDRLVITFEDVFNAIAAIPAALGVAFDAYREQEQAVNELNQSMINAGTFSAELQNKYLELAAALQKTTLFSDDQINSAQSLLQAHIGNKEVTSDLLKATLDLAQAKKMDLASAASLVGKAIGGESEVLKRYGITVKESSNDSEKLANVTEALNKKFGGQAEEARKGAGGVDGFKMSMGELAEAIGSRIAPAFILLAEKATPIIDLLAQFIDKGDLSKKSVNELGHAIVKTQDELVRLIELKNKSLTPAESGYEGQIAAMTARLAEQNAAFQKQLEDEQLSKDNAFLNDQTRREADSLKQQEKILKDGENQLVQEQINAELLQAQREGNDLKESEARLKNLQNLYKNETDFQQKKLLLQAISAEQKTKQDLQAQKFEELVQKQRLQGFSTFFSGVASLSQSSNAQLAAIGKAAAISQASIDAYLAIQNALATVPYPANIAAAAGIGIQAFANVSKIAGIPLAEGGIVKARPGGIQATIGEGGRDEAVIPLENGQIPGSNSGGVTINVYGGMLGDERTAQEFAGAVDRELLKLRQNGGSVAFDRIN